MNRSEFITTVRRGFNQTVVGSPKHLEIVGAYNSINPLPRNYKVSITDPWCAIFVSAMWRKYMSGWFPYECSCTKMISLLKEEGRFYRTKEPSPGDLIFYDWERDGAPDHVGYVEYTDNTFVYTIEGNRSSQVKECEILLDSKSIYGFGVLDYGDESDEAKRWVTKNQIMRGDGTDTYWSQPPTREQLATIFYRFYKVT